MRSRLVALATGLSVLVSCHGVGPASAAPILHIHDSANRLGTVDIGTGAVTIIGNLGADPITDIAFDPNGNLFGLSFTNLYRINASTAAVTLVGPHGIPGGNALVFGTDGTLYGAGFQGTNLFAVNPSTGQGTALGNIGFSSAGDLAFNSGNLFLSSTTDQLIRITLSGGVSGTAVGSLGFPEVFGLATDDKGVLFGVSGTRIFSVNTGTGAGTLVLNYAGSGLGQAGGTSFFTEAGAGPAPAVPEPSAVMLAAIGLAGLLYAKVRFRTGCSRSCPS